jgi:transcriptional regulator with XRE-family HTH domain
MTQSDLARRIGCQPMQISRWERGEATPIAAFVIELERIFGLSARELFVVEPVADEPSAAE